MQGEEWAKDGEMSLASTMVLSLGYGGVNDSRANVFDSL